MTFKSLHTYKCADGRTAEIVSPIIKVAGREDLLDVLFQFDTSSSVITFTSFLLSRLKRCRIETEHQEGPLLFYPGALPLCLHHEAD